jgi:hypothetical protein
MDRSNANILFSLLLGVALFLFIAYCAVKTIDSSQPDNYFIVSQGVDFHDGIQNAPTQTTYAQYEQTDLSIPEYSPKNSAYASSSAETYNDTHRSEYANKFGGASSTNKSAESNSSVATLALNSRNQQDAAKQDASATTTSSLTTNGLTNGNTAGDGTKKVGDGFGGVNEGEDPTGPPIPVGDGLLFLLFLASIYTLWKSTAKIRQRLTHSIPTTFSLKNKNVRT